MREIKFRSWSDTDNGDSMIYYGNLNSFDNGLWFDSSEHIDEVYHVMQFTGLFDKNGKEIYESDILQTCTDKAMVVSWSTKYCSFVLNREGWAFSHWFGESCNPEDCIIIGNIHENPELLCTTQD